MKIKIIQVKIVNRIKTSIMLNKSLLSINIKINQE